MLSGLGADCLALSAQELGASLKISVFDISHIVEVLCESEYIDASRKGGLI